MSELHQRLRTVIRRQRFLVVLRDAAIGLLMGALVAVLLAVLRLFVEMPEAAQSLQVGSALTILAGVALGAAVGWLRPLDWRRAATAVDAHYQLKDRSVTALEFASSTDPGELQKLQITDAVRHLEEVDSKAVVPFRVPTVLAYGALLLLASGLLLLLPVGRPPDLTAAPREINPVVAGEAERLEEQLVEDLERLAEQHEDRELGELAEELRQMVEELQLPGVDQAEALAKLSEMQAALAEAQARYNLEAVDGQLRDLAEAISPAASLRAAADALREGKYEQAAEELEEFDAADVDAKEAKTVAEKLEELAKDLKEADLTELSEAAAEFAEGLEKQDAAQCKQGANSLAGECRAQGMRKDIAKSLAARESMLAQCKSNCRSASSSKSQKNGGNGVSESKSAKTTWGNGKSGKPLGDKATKIESQRKRENVTGVKGDGPSEREVSTTQDARQEATRSLRDRFKQYQRQSEAVLQNENLPLGHRETIRNYFESIRPEREEAAVPTESDSTSAN